MTTTTTKFNPALERVKCAGKITGVTAKWVIFFPIIGVYEYGRTVRQWHKTGRVGLSTTTFVPPFMKPCNKCETTPNNEEQGEEQETQQLSEKVLKGLGLTLFFLRPAVFFVPYYLVKECQKVHEEHKQTMQAHMQAYNPLL